MQWLFPPLRSKERALPSRKLRDVMGYGACTSDMLAIQQASYNVLQKRMQQEGNGVR